jgi:hypothetical protein
MYVLAPNFIWTKPNILYYVCISERDIYNYLPEDIWMRIVVGRRGALVCIIAGWGFTGIRKYVLGGIGASSRTVFSTPNTPMYYTSVAVGDFIAGIFNWSR